MNTANLQFLSVLQIQDDTGQTTAAGREYQQVLDSVRSSIASDHADELAAALDSAEAMQTLKSLIYKYAAEQLAGSNADLDELTERIYQDMAGLGILTKHLLDPEVEEINVNGYDMVEIIRPDGTVFLEGRDAFPSQEAALAVVKRMLRMGGGGLLDAQTPHVDSEMESGTRISSSIPPLIPAQAGVYASIRKQRAESAGVEDLITSGAATRDMMDFLSLCLCNGVSVGIAGSTGAGKTTLETSLINEYLVRNEDYNNRTFLIEDSREIVLKGYDEEHGRPARVLYYRTNEKETMQSLLTASLRMDPNLIIPAEVRDGAAYVAAEAGRTGHTILTSFHADGARNGYLRLVELCRMAGTNQSDEVLLAMCISAWPVMVYQRQLKDRSRRMMEIFEASGQKDGHVEGNLLFRYVIEATERDGFGRITRVRGHHERCGCISPALFRRLTDNGAPESVLRRIFPEAEADG